MAVFTFESSVHSSHVLRCLDEQRRRDTFCDVTVVAEGQSFRAHRSVLTSCSEYFSHRVSGLTQHGGVISLPQEVTAAGFEPLLQFAYTSKLLFRKDNVLDIRNSASILGFRDLDEACFDFLLPKFFSSSRASFPRKTCCKKKCERRLSREGRGVDSDDALLGEKEAKPVADSPLQQEVARPCHKSASGETGSRDGGTGVPAPVPEKTNSDFTQCPKYRKFQLACGKESCVVEKRLQNAVKVIRDVCDLSCMPCSNTKQETEVEFPGTPASSSAKDAADDSRKTEEHNGETGEERRRRRGDVMKDDGKRNEDQREADVSRAGEEMGQTARFGSLDGSNVKKGNVGSSLVPGGRSVHHCPPRASDEGHDVTMSLGQEMYGMDFKEKTNTRDASVVKTEQTEAGGDDGDNTRGGTRALNTPGEAAEGLDSGPSRPNVHDLDVGSSSDTGSERVPSAPSEWPRPGGSGCPFLLDGDRGKCAWKAAAVLSECEGASQSGVSSLNSGEDGDSETETEGDSEAYARERARQVQLPFSVDWIVELSRNDFQHLLKQQVFTPEQLDFVHDMRRRSKNRLAAQRCRKRKLDCIHNLQCEIQKLRTEREKLLMEKSQLSQMKLSTRDSVSSLCQRVCNEANLQPEQIQVLAKYTSSDCPLASFFPYIDALLSQPGLSADPEGPAMAVEDHPASEFMGL